MSFIGKRCRSRSPLRDMGAAALLIVCPGCQDHIAESTELLCKCGRCMVCGRKVKAQDLPNHRSQHDKAEIDRLEMKWSIPTGREAEIREIIEARQRRRWLRVFVVMLVIVCLFSCFGYFQNRAATIWERSFLCGGVMIAAGLIVALFDRLFFRFPLPLGRK
jgi:hypothetical protein